MFWHPQGDHLAVRVDRFTKTRKSTYTSFELFSVKERDIPMEVRGARHTPVRACLLLKDTKQQCCSGAGVFCLLWNADHFGALWLCMASADAPEAHSKVALPVRATLSIMTCLSA